MDPQRARELLNAERERIEQDLRSLDQQDENEEPADAFDPVEQASELNQREFAEGAEEDLRARLAAVERAEQRLAAGTYGVSIESGQPISDERLEAFPAAERTVEEERARTQR